MQRNLAICILGLALGVPTMASAAQTTQSASQQARLRDEELDEVTVEGRRLRPRKAQQSFDFLARLVGEFTIEGFVIPRPTESGPADTQEARGAALCVGFGVAPGVQCDLRVHWEDATGPDGEEIPGGAPTLNPAVMLFGFNLGAHSNPMSVPIDPKYRYASPNAVMDPESYTIAHILVDNTGVAESGAGFRVGSDAMTSRSPCVAIPANCERLVQISAPADLETIQLRFDLEIDGAVVMRYDLVMHRVADSKSVVFGRGPVKRKGK